MSGLSIYMEYLVSNPSKGLWSAPKMKKLREVAALDK